MAAPVGVRRPAAWFALLLPGVLAAGSTSVQLAIAVTLVVLARALRSRALVVIAAIYAALVGWTGWAEFQIAPLGFPLTDPYAISVVLLPGGTCGSARRCPALPRAGSDVRAVRGLGSRHGEISAAQHARRSARRPRRDPRLVDALEGHPDIEMHSLMLVRHGQVVAEGWWAPYSAGRPHLLYSLSKSFTSTAAAFARGRGPARASTTR